VSYGNSDVLPSRRPRQAWSNVERASWSEALLAHIADGKSLAQFCELNKHGPDISTFQQWRANDADFARKYVWAREDGADAIADEIVGITDAVLNSPDTDRIEAARLAVDARKWIVSKLKPRIQHQP
jgi:hypothetical protein